MILRYGDYSCSLRVVRCAWGEDDGERAAGGKSWQRQKQQEQEQLQEFRVSGEAAALRTWRCSSSCCRRGVLWFLPPVSGTGTVGVSSSRSVEIGSRLALLQQLLFSFWRVLVLRSSTRPPRFFLISGNVTMEDTNSVDASGLPQSTGPGHGLGSGDVSSLVGKEAGKECTESDSSKLSPQLSCGVSTPAKQQVQEAISQHSEDGVSVSGTLQSGACGQTTPSANKDAVSESVVLNGPDVQSVSSVPSAGESAVDSSGQPPAANADTDEGKEDVEAGNSRTIDSLGNGKLEGAKNSVPHETAKSAEQIGDEVLSTAKTTLMGALEKLMSLDPSDVFKDPVYDSFAPNYSKVIKTPMCFSTMQDKIEKLQYDSWRSFVEDFERICYNAMKYNQKRSRIWNAASTLLRQGKKVMEPYFELGDSVLGSRKVPDSAENAVQDVVKNAVQDAAENAVQDVLKDVVRDVAENAAQGVVKNGVKVVALIATSELGKDEPAAPRHVVVQGGSVPILIPESSEVLGGVPSSELELCESQGGVMDPLHPSEVSKDVVNQTENVAPSVSGAYMTRDDKDLDGFEGYMADASNETRVKHGNEDVKVEVLDSSGSEDVRPDSRDEATECSSSFGYTQSNEESDVELDGFQQNAEVESELRDGNGALSSVCAEDDEVAGGNERGKKALNADWKRYRRGIEWRCRWLEIRLNELRARARNYDRMLEERRARKAWLAVVQPGEESSARTAPMIDGPQRGHILRRLRRKQVENTVDLDEYMARHPLFSRYDKKKKGETEDTYVETKLDTTQLVQNQQNFMELERRVLEGSDTEEQVILGRSSVGGQDSMEQILWKVEALQARVDKAKSQLGRGGPSKNVTHPLAFPKPPSNLLRGASQASLRVSPLGTVLRPPGTKGGSPAGQLPWFSGTPSANGAPLKQGSASLRRKSSDYDINNMVMPVSAGAKYVEHLKHADIWTPHWRLAGSVETANQSRGGSSSDEDTDDEHFENRHFELEVIEKKQRYMLPQRSPDVEPTLSVKGRSKSGMGKGAGKFAGRRTVALKEIAPESIDPPVQSSSPAFTGCIRKGKRRKRLFNATSFTSNHAQRLAAYIAEPSTLQSPEGVGESIAVEDMVEGPLEEKSTEIFPDRELKHANFLPINSADQPDLKRKKSVTSGLQVLANP